MVWDLDLAGPAGEIEPGGEIEPDGYTATIARHDLLRIVRPRFQRAGNGSAIDRLRGNSVGVNHFSKLAEQVLAVVRSGRRFGMVLNAKRRMFAMFQTGDRIVV